MLVPVALMSLNPNGIELPKYPKESGPGKGTADTEDPQAVVIAIIKTTNVLLALCFVTTFLLFDP
jgi:hypothetical protein